jgi:TRAP-type C4-dicarboxylate transport system permease small subunit
VLLPDGGFVNFPLKRVAHKLTNEVTATIVTGIVELIAGLLIAIFSGSLARASVSLNKRILGIELPVEWSKAATVIIGALLSFAGLLKLLGLPPI